jgi:hypothetical protein
MLGIGLGLWRSRFICRFNMLFACKIVVPFPLSIGEILGYFFYNKLHLFSHLVNQQSEGVVQGKGPWRKIMAPLKTHHLNSTSPQPSLDLPHPGQKFVQSTQKTMGFPEYLGVRKNARSLDRGVTTVVF